MQSWTSDAILLTKRPLGESSVIVDVFSHSKGFYSGAVQGGGSRKHSGALQPGAQTFVQWSGRLDTQLGRFKVEVQRSRSAFVLHHKEALLGLSAVCQLLSHSLPQGVAHERLYQQTVMLLDLLPQFEVWPLAYLQWELALLSELGSGLDLSSCAVTGHRDDLAYISPKTGRAISAQAAGEWRHRLLPFVPVLRGEGEAERVDVAQALRVTGHFFDYKVFASTSKRGLPSARGRLIDAWS